MKIIKEMKTIKRIIVCCFSAVLFFAFNACQDMLDTDSNRLAFDDEYELTDPQDPRFALNGIYAEMQQIADRYVLLGELRGDLMKATDIANLSLQEINQFQVSAGNEYVDKRDYYSIINNCNLALQRMDTALTIHTEKVMLPAYAQIKTMRAWTYFQLAQIFGKVIYLTEPITDLEASLVQHAPITIDALVEKLISDLIPYAAVLPASSNITPFPFMPAAALLGDLYLYQQNYQQAARMYYQVMSGAATNSSYPISIGNHANRWGSGFEVPSLYQHWYSYPEETFAVVIFDRDSRKLHSRLVSLSFNDRPSILPTDNYVEFMNTAPYFHTSSESGTGAISYREGDLRGNIPMTGTSVGGAYFYTNIQGSSQQVPLIFKYFQISNFDVAGSDPENNLLNNNFNAGWDRGIYPAGLYYPEGIPIYRRPHLYLRYAEAVNRAGKPTLAFAVLKYGLTNTTVTNAARVNPSELGEDFTNFQNFSNNTAMAVRGRGYGIQSPNAYTIPDYTRMVLSGEVDENGDPIYVPSLDAGDLLAAKQDSILWVEDRILEELAAETAFEGNRFFDLMCISRNRPNHPEFMAEKVSAKYENAEAMKAKLMTLDNWFLP